MDILQLARNLTRQVDSRRGTRKGQATALASAAAAASLLLGINKNDPSSFPGKEQSAAVKEIHLQDAVA